MPITVQIASRREEDTVLDLIGEFHALGHIPHDRPTVALSVRALLEATGAGRIWLILFEGKAIGYAALCFGYSIELQGRDAFLDEMYLVEKHRNKGYGKAALSLVKTQAKNLGVKALHLEVDRGNETAQRLYASLGFEARDRYFLMTQVL